MSYADLSIGFIYSPVFTLNLVFLFQDSDGEKSDDLVVDVSNEVRWGVKPLSRILHHKGFAETKHSSLLSVEASTPFTMLPKSLS